MVAAVPDYVGSEFKEAPPGHRFRLYWSGWWSSELEESRPEAARRRSGRAVHLGQSDESERAAACEFTLGSAARLAGAFQARQEAVARLVGGSDRILVRKGTLSTPLTIGLGHPHPLQNGFSFLDPYGVPCLTGSSVKGVLRKAAEDLALRCEGTAWRLADVLALFGVDATASYLKPGRESGELREHATASAEAMSRQEWSEALAMAWPAREREELDVREKILALLRATDRAERDRLQPRFRGLLECWDVVPVASAGAPFRVDIMNPHQRGYYEQKGWAGAARTTSTPSEDQVPVPVNFMTVPAGAKVSFVLRYRGRGGLVPDGLLDRWAPLLDQALHFAGEVNGFGAKTSAGYGRVTFTHLRVPSGAGQDTGADSAWSPCVVKYEAGRKELMAQASDGRRAFARQGEVDALFGKLGEALRDRLKKKREVKGLTATVAPEGNSFKLVMLAEGK